MSGVFDSINNEPQLNDFVDFVYKEKNNNVYIEIHIWKLIEKEYCGEKNKNGAFGSGRFAPQVMPPAVSF